MTCLWGDLVDLVKQAVYHATVDPEVHNNHWFFFDHTVNFNILSYQKNNSCRKFLSLPVEVSAYALAAFLHIREMWCALNGQF